MPPRFQVPPVPDSPEFWADLEQQLVEVTTTGLTVADVQPTPSYETHLTDQLTDRTPRVARRERLPLGSLAAAAVAVVALAGALTFSTGQSIPLTAATPGAETTTTLAAPVSGEAMVVASFQRWVDGRTEAERMTNRLTNEGYDVVVRRLNVSNPTQNGQVLAIRHGIGITGTTIAQPRGQVILVIGRAITAGANVSG